MSDQVNVLDATLPEGAVMRVPERQVILDDGTTVLLRRFWYDDEGRRCYLADGRWLAQRGGPVLHLYAAPEDGIHGVGAYWAYRTVHSFPTWGDALAAAVLAEAAEQGRRIA